MNQLRSLWRFGYWAATDEHGRIVGSSPGLDLLLGWQIGGLFGQPATVISGGPVEARLDRYHETMARTGFETHTAILRRRQDGLEFPYASASKRLMTNAGRPAAVAFGAPTDTRLNDFPAPSAQFVLPLEIAWISPNSVAGRDSLRLDATLSDWERQAVLGVLSAAPIQPPNGNGGTMTTTQADAMSLDENVVEGQGIDPRLWPPIMTPREAAVCSGWSVRTIERANTRHELGLPYGLPYGGPSKARRTIAREALYYWQTGREWPPA